jgi:hypothetical protein
VIIVDSNVWAGFFNGESSPHVARLERALRDEEDLAILPIILTEVLQGFRTDTGFQRALRLLLPLPAIEPGIETHVRAARLFRALRRRGVTVRGAVDCVIAQTCVDTDSELLSPDGDFARIARVLPLRLWVEE